MEQEDKQLLLKDLSARLPYGVKILHTGWDCDSNTDFNTVETLIGIDDRFIYTVWDKTGDRERHCLSVSNWKPYLRPMSSMTEEERKELKCLFDAKNITNDSICFLEGGTLEEYEAQIPFSFCSKLIDWLNAHHFDFRNLIERGLAIDCTGLNVY